MQVWKLRICTKKQADKLRMVTKMQMCRRRIPNIDKRTHIIGHCAYIYETQSGLFPGLGRLFMGRDPVELAERAKYKPPAMRVRGVCYTKKSPFRYNEVVQANI